MTKKMMTPEEALKDAENNGGIVFDETSRLSPSDVEKRFAKVRITTMIDLVLKEKLKEEAEKLGTKYQVLLNQILKQYFDKKQEHNLAARLKEVESKLEEILTKTRNKRL